MTAIKTGMVRKKQLELPDEKKDEKKSIRSCVIAGACAAVVYFAFVFLVFGSWVHYYYAGVYSGPLMISTLFGVSEKSAEAGARPIYAAPVAGWDGQFYYTQSNDPLLREDYSQSSLFDSTSYRFQRNGLSALARLTALLSGQDATTPLTYFVTQLIVMSLGCGTLVAFLMHQRVHWGWAGVWAFYGGVLRPFAHGLPDPTADSLLLVAIVTALSGRVWLYVIAASALCLCRESYAAPAAAIWLLTVVGKLDWKQRASYWVRIAITALPGVVVLGWAFYVADRTGTEFLAGSRSIPWGGLVDWPFKAYFSCLWIDIKASDENDVIYATSCAACLLTVLATVLVHVRRAPLAIAILPHVLLMTMTGWIVWEAGVGFFKNTSSVVLLGVILLGLAPTRVLRIVLLVTFVASLHYIYRADHRHLGFLPPLPVVAVDESHEGSMDLIRLPVPVEYASQVELIAAHSVGEDYLGLFRWFHRHPRRYTVRITNMSTLTWPASIAGEGAVSLGRQLMSGEKVLQEDRFALYKPVVPGGSIDFMFMLPSSRGVIRSPIARVGVVQDGNAWFHWHDTKQKLDIPY